MTDREPRASSILCATNPLASYGIPLGHRHSGRDSSSFVSPAPYGFLRSSAAAAVPASSAATLATSAGVATSAGAATAGGRGSTRETRQRRAGPM